jgi:hypothetical protein
MFQELPLAGNFALFAGAALVVWLAGARIAGYADAIAEQTGIGREIHYLGARFARRAAAGRARHRAARHGGRRHRQHRRSAEISG